MAEIEHGSYQRGYRACHLDDGNACPPCKAAAAERMRVRRAAARVVRLAERAAVVRLVELHADVYAGLVAEELAERRAA